VEQRQQNNWVFDLTVLSDLRHRNIKLLFNESINQPSFANWKIRLVGDLRKDSNYKMFLNRFSDKFVAGSDIEQTLADNFDIAIRSFVRVA